VTDVVAGAEVRQTPPRRSPIASWPTHQGPAQADSGQLEEVLASMPLRALGLWNARNPAEMQEILKSLPLGP
jgi:hypothetical protein